MTKKPSALCMPLACQPDPACYPRSRKHLEEPAYPYQPTKRQLSKDLSRRHSVPMQTTLSDDQDHKEVHMTQSDVDAVLARYDTIFEGDGLESPSEKCESESSKASYKAKMMPRIPARIKKQQEKMKNLDKKDSLHKTISKQHNNVGNLQVEEITPEVLDSMLSELMNSEIKPNEANRRKENTKSVSQKSSEIRNRDETTKNINNLNINTDSSNNYCPSFNYQDIASNMSKAQLPINNKTNQTAPVMITPSLRSPRLDSQNMNVEPPSIKTKLSASELQSDDNGIMELHRSKSYIVNLIDRALSKELGTIPDEIYPSIPKEVNNDNTKHAACTVRKHDKTCESGLYFEISQSQGDSLQHNAVAHPVEDEVKHDYSCTCNVQDEPLYIKQLRQLRWGHLKHIQMEVRRLEDLERFLDTCTTPLSR